MSSYTWKTTQKKGSHIISRQLFQQNEAERYTKKDGGKKNKKTSLINVEHYCHILKQEGFFKAFLSFCFVYSRKATHKRTRVVVSCKMYSPVPHRVGAKEKRVFTVTLR